MHTTLLSFFIQEYLMASLFPRLRSAIHAGTQEFNRATSGIGNRYLNQSRGKYRPSETDQALVDRFKSWVYIACNRNGVEIASNYPPKLYVVTGSNQHKSRRKTIPISKQQKDILLSNKAISSLARVKQAEEIEEVVSHPSMELLINPNEIAGGSFQLAYMKSIYSDLTGDSYFWIPKDEMGMPSRIFVLPTQWTYPIRTRQDAATYGIKASDVEWDSPAPIKGYAFGSCYQNRIYIPGEQVVPFRYPNPANPLDGYGALQGVIMTAVRDEAMDSYEAALNRNMGRPDYAIMYETDLSETERNAINAELSNRYGGVQNSGKPLVTGGAKDIKNLGFSPREMAFLQGRPWARDQIANGFGIPPSLLSSKEINRATLDAALYQYAKYTIYPRLKMDEQVLNEKYLPMFDNAGFAPDQQPSSRLFFAFDNPVPADKEFDLKKRESDLKNYVITINEARTDDGKEDVGWGEVPIAPFNVAPLGSAMIVEDNQATPKHIKRVERDIPPAFLETATKADENDIDRTGAANPPMDAAEKDLAKVTDEMFALEIGAIMAQNPLSIDFDSAYYAKKFTPKALMPIAKVTLKAGDTALRSAGIEVIPWIDNPAVQKSIRDETFHFLDQASKTLEDAFRKSLERGVAQGENIQELTARLEDVFRKEVWSERSRMIARTETTRAATNGQISAWEESGVVTGKFWLTASDPCPFCKNMSEQYGEKSGGISLRDSYWEKGQIQEVPFGEKDEAGNQRLIKLSHNYSDVVGPPLHPNCRCTLAPIVEGT